MKKQCTHISDTKQFIVEIEQVNVKQNALFITYDVTSLYTNLRFAELLTSMEYELEHNNHIDYGMVKPPTQSLIDIAELLLTKNEFEFNGHYYRQIIGAPQGSVPSPELCDIAIYHHIKRIIDQYDFKAKIQFHKRFRDDGFMIFEGERNQAELLLQTKRMTY